MSKRKFTFFVLALAMLSGTAAAQDRLTDDRELFMGVPTASSIIRPNVMILVDVTGSMTQSIYHPYFNRKLDYSKDTLGSTLTINNLSNYLYEQGGYPTTCVPYDSNSASSTYMHPMTREFRVCRNNETVITTYDVRGKVTSVANVTGQPNWRRWNLNSVNGTFVVNQIIQYIGVDNLTHYTKIKQVYSQTRLYIDKLYEATYVEPKLNTYFYVNPHSESRTLSVDLLPTGTACGAGETAYDVKLYAKATTTHAGGEVENDYDKQYLFWLFFQATPEQIAEVNNWSNTGEFTAGVPAGRSRISVAKEAVYQIIVDNYDKFNLGLSVFSSNTSGASLKVKIKQQNTGNPLTTFQTQVNSMTAGGSTPLAAALADIWSYFKGTFRTNYNINDGNQSLDALDDRPIRYWCQSNYVILLTDGESNGDQSFTSGRFAGSLISSNPDLSNGWGVADGHDITRNSSGTVTNNWYNTSIPNYCTNYSCWSTSGTDWLDDIAYLMYNNDLFPNNIDQAGNPYTNMPTKQFVETFTIGFSINNDMLFNTAEYGNTSKGAGAYRSANNYSELMDAIQNFIVNISLRDFGFSSFTAPKKVSSAAGEGSSFVGYFKPKSGEAIWEGHLQSFKLTDKWCPDSNGDSISNDNCITYYGSKLSCENANPGLTCLRSIDLASTPDWDTATLIAAGGDRLLYTHNYASGTPLALINFTDVGNIPTLRPLFGVATDANAQTIVDAIKAKHLADIFHSDIAYVGPPIPGKKYLKNLNPSECNTDDKATNANCFEKLAVDQANRQKVLYVGTNDGIIHQVNATTGEANSGKELWGFIPDEVLPALATIGLDNEFAFTTDGRMQVDDIYYRGTTNMWKTLLAFGLRDGGNAFYALDITTAASQPVILWKFKEPTYSGKSWGKPNFGKIKYWDGNETIDLWVVIVAGGFAFNNENPNDLQGKAIFVLDASTGLPLWTLAFHGSGQADDSGTPEIDTLLDSSNLIGLRYRTAKPEFNYCIPAALIPVDRDMDGYLDTIYYGNVAGHMFKTDISPSTPNTWKSYLLFKNTATPTISARVSSAVGTLVTLTGVSGAFAENQNVFASGTTSSHAMGIVNGVNSPTSLTIAYTPNSGPSFQVNDTIVVPKFDPIYLSPAIFFDPCYNLWVAFGTGDRLRSRTNPDSGKFAAFRDGTTLVSSTQTQKTDLTTSDLVSLSWTGDTLAQTDVNVTNKWGWYFTFPQSANHEKMFDPEPLILPDMYMIPHIYFNTYQPSTMITGEDCNAPEEGNMKFYDLTMNYCGDGTVEGARESGRIAGGGMFQGSDFILYEGTGNVASIPPLQDIKPIKLIYTGGLLFFKEKKR